MVVEVKLVQIHHLLMKIQMAHGLMQVVKVYAIKILPVV